MSSKKKSTTKTNTTQTNAPPSWTAGGLEATAGMVQGALGQIPTTHYSGQQVAYMSPQELAAIQGAWGETAGLAGDYTDWMGQRLPELSDLWDWQTQLPTESFNMGSMQDVNPVIQASLNPLYRQLTEQLLPGINYSSLDSGAYSGDRAMGVLPESVMQDYSREAADISTQIGYQNYKDFENRRLQAWMTDQDRLLAGYGAETQRGLGQNASQTAMMGAESDYISNILHNSASVGDLLKMSADLGVSVDQAAINDALAQDKYASYAPFMGLDQAAQLLALLSGDYGTQTMVGKTTTKEKTGGLGEWVKGAVGLGSLAASAFGMNPLAAMGSAGAAGAGAAVDPYSAAKLWAPSASSIFGPPS